MRVSPGQYQRIIHDPVSPLPEALDLIYSGDPITTNLKAGIPCQTPSADSVAVMLEGLELELGMKVHTIGTRTGYEAALLAEIVGDQQLVSATGLDGDTETRIRSMLERSGYGDIDIRPLDGFYGNPERAPFDRILVLVGCPDISPHWVSQLEPQGFLLVPMGHGGWFPLLRVWKDTGTIMARAVGSAGSAIDEIGGELQHPGAIRRIVRESDATVRELPLWPGMLGSALFTRLRDYWFYLGVRSPQSSCMMNVTKGGRVIAKGIGLDIQDIGWAIITSGTYRMLGHLAALQELDRTYSEWEDLGRPRAADYIIELAAKAEARASKPNSHWLIGRLLYWQKLWLQ